MKYLFLILVVLLHTSPLPSQIPVLASVEIRQKPSPPVKKTKTKTRVKKKKAKKKHFKKHNQQLQHKKHFIASLVLTIIFFLGAVLSTLLFLSSFLIALGLLVFIVALSGFIIFGILTIALAKKNQQDRQRSIAKSFLIIMIVFIILGGAALLAFSLLFGYTIISIALGLIFGGTALIFLIAFLAYKAKLKKEKEAGLKKSDTALKAEVNYLAKKDVRTYLLLHERLTSLEVQRAVALRTKNQTVGIERKEAKLKVKDLDRQIKRIKVEISELRRENKINKVLENRK